MKTYLFSTVGGSHQPILQAVEQLQPDHIVFVCSSGSQSSVYMIQGQGKVIKANKEDKKPSLPNIPTQLQLHEDQFEVLKVDPDDLDAITEAISRRVTKIREEFPQSPIYADYTGGTKSMTGGLILTALDYDLDLHLVKGQRSDLEKVTDGTQWGVPASVERIKFDRALANHLQAWNLFAYGQAAAGLRSITLPAKTDIQDRFLMAKNLSEAFDAWDRFDHDQARKLLMPYRARLNKIDQNFIEYFKILDVLTNREHAIREPALIYDLWLNSLRCARQCRFDDGVARIYRMIEWIAQWVLKDQFNVDSSDLPEDFIPKEVDLRKNRDGKYQAPLYYSWQLVKHKAQGPLAEFIKSQEKDLRTVLEGRNSSILAHGQESVTTHTWKKTYQWFEDKLLPAFQQDVKHKGLKKWPPQLPDTFPEL